MANVDNIIRVYDSNMNRLAYLENAYNISYEMSLNSLWYASFAMPANDIKNQYLEPFHFVELFDNGKRIELFRIMPSKLTRNNQGDIVYECEHVLATLLDDVLFQYHQIGNVGVFTTQCLRYVLDRQTVKRWQLQTNEFQRQFEYKWENENLLSALFSIPKPFNEAYKWEFNTVAYPWRLSLKAIDSTFKADIMYKKNMLQIEKEVDPSTVVTRLYCLGYGEGDNQLDIRGVNNNVPYLEANIAKYGVKASILVDRRFESTETLKAYGQSLLEGLKEPYKSYKVNAIDLHRLDNFKYEELRVGDTVRIVDKEDDITEDLPIVSIKKGDVVGDPASIEIEIANKGRDIAGSISELADRTRINEVYAQGATNLMSIAYADNADSSSPAIVRFFLPNEMARINKLILNYQLEPFRAYSKAIEDGGGETSGSSSRDTTKDGGGETSGSSSRDTTKDGGGDTSGSSSRDTTKDGGGDTSGVDGNYVQGGGHNHGIYQGTKLAEITGYNEDGPVLGEVTWVQSGEHTHRIDDHKHYMDHTHNIKEHKHDMNHTHDLPEHKHDMAHTHNINPHTHEIQFGIYQGSTAQSATLKIDGQSVNITDKEVNIIPYLAKDNSGRVQRGTWHTVEIVPSSLTRVVASVFIQLFTNSRGGGDY